jgi:hypothetical protein
MLISDILIKTVHMSWNEVVGIASTFTLLVPVILIILYRLYSNRSLQALLVYYFLSAVYNLMLQGILPASNELRVFFGTLNNYLDAPLMMFFLMFFCTDKWKIRAIQCILLVFLAYEVVIAFAFGFALEANVYILGPGISIILIISGVLFVRQIKRTIVLSKGLGKTLMLASIIFSYGCFGLIYLFHYIEKMKNVGDIFLIYFIASFIASMTMMAGIMLIRKHLNDLKEIKLARRELQVFFNNPVPGK